VPLALPDGNPVTPPDIGATTPLPEPSSFALLGPALVAGLGYARRRRTAAG